MLAGLTRDLDNRSCILFPDCHCLVLVFANGKPKPRLLEKASNSGGCQWGRRHSIVVTRTVLLSSQIVTNEELR